jgi:SH3 domain protein
MKRYWLISIIILGLCLMVQESWAQKVYVTDVFRISFRSGPGIENRILKFLHSGTQVEVLETGEEWTQVRLLEADGGEAIGWVLNRYLMTREPWELQTKSLLSENARLTERVGFLEKENNELSVRNKRLTGELDKVTTSLNKSEYAYTTLKKGSADYLKIKAAYDNIKNRTDVLSRENEVLKSAQTNKWFATGALVLLCGLMIGVVIGRQQKKRRSSLYV